jgi:hypothetical protein
MLLGVLDYRSTIKQQTLQFSWTQTFNGVHIYLVNIEVNQAYKYSIDVNGI